MDTVSDAIPGERLRGQLLLLRGRARLTQRALAALLGISEHAVQKWEAGEGFPSPARLQALIEVYVTRGVFPAGRAAEEARVLWALLQGETGQRTPPFDEAWFATVFRTASAGSALSRVVDGDAEEADQPVKPEGPRHDWGEAPDVTAFQGRATELQTLRRWVLEEHCRVVEVLGLGGIGKTALATRLAQDLAPHCEVVCWRSLRNAPLPEEWLEVAIAALAPAPPVLPAGRPARLGLLLELLRARRCLLVLDNLETVLEAGQRTAGYRDGYEGYGELLRALGERTHQSCLLLTGRETPPELAVLAGAAGPVRTLRLGGLDPVAARMLLQETGLEGDDAAWEALVGRYGGNPLALRVAGQAITEVFGGDITAFLAYAAETSGAVFGGLRQLLEEHFMRLSPLEQNVLYWLVVEREPVGVVALTANLGPGVGRGALLEVLAGLGRRSLLERGAQGGTHTLRPVVLEYATERLVAEVVREIIADEPRLLVSHVLAQTQAKQYVRRSQEQLIAQPLLEHLRTSLGSAEAVEQRLLELLAGWRGRPAGEQGYGPGNVVNLLRLLRGHLRGLDLSHLALRQAYLAEVEAQDASLAGAHLSETVLAGSFNHPSSIALNADGGYLAAGTATGDVYLWRVKDCALLAIMHGHMGIVLDVALSANGQLVASSSADGTVRLWAAESGQLLATLQGHNGAVWGVALSGDGQLVASGGCDGTVCLWEAAHASGSPYRLLATLEGHAAGIWDVALSADGRFLASSSADGSVCLWEAAHASGSPYRLLATLEGHAAGIRAVALSADGSLLASGGFDGTVRLWETEGGRLRATLQGHTGAVYAVALSAEARLVVSGGFDGTIRLWLAESGQQVATLQEHAGAVQGVTLRDDGRFLASSSDDGTIKLWDSPNGHLLATLQGYTGGVPSVALGADARLVVSGGFDGAVRLWEMAPHDNGREWTEAANVDESAARLRATLVGHTGGVCGVTLSADGRLVASGGFDGTARLWEAAGGRILATLAGHSGTVPSVSLSGDGRLLASCSVDGTAKLWEVPSGRLLTTLHGHTGGLLVVALSRDGSLVASCGFDGTVRLWEAPAGRPLATLWGSAGGIYSVALSGDGGLVAGGGQDGCVRIWEVPSGRLVATLRANAGLLYSVAVSADGRWVACGGQDGTAKVWELPTERLMATLYGHRGPIYCVAPSEDGHLLASSSQDGTVKLWGVSSSTCLLTLRTDRCYERLDITDLTGVTEAQHASLLALGAVLRSD